MAIDFRFGPPENKTLLGESQLGKAPRASAQDVSCNCFVFAYLQLLFFSGIRHGVNGHLISWEYPVLLGIFTYVLL